MTDPIEFQRRPRGWGEMFDAPPLGNTARFRGDAAAVFGDDDKEEFRYALARCWDHNLPLWLWVMLNPSTATESENDRTVTRCLDFTWRLSRQKAGGLVIVNLFAHRATEWRELRRVHNPVGSANDEWIQRILQSGRISKIILAWGNPGQKNFSDSRRRDVLHLLHDSGSQLFQLGEKTQKGAPPHPVRLLNDSPLCLYQG